MDHQSLNEEMPDGTPRISPVMQMIKPEAAGPLWGQDVARDGSVAAQEGREQEDCPYERHTIGRAYWLLGFHAGILVRLQNVACGVL